MKVDRLDIDVRVEGVLVEENRATSVMGHVEATCKNVMIDMLRRILQGNEMPPSCNFVSRRHLLFSVGVQDSSWRC